ncbi:NADPH-dependent FMN reductase [Membranihabitans marinus]|uniref:NADPH-dependent FMN reductase n=1 Tax=Membranihabitans marinus TaxID=1227546 RepID=UPI001F3D85B1|nr:NADPH-dependent FMN reductase [Membranihabitans marinus]
MPKIQILSSSVRTGRNSHRVALYFKQFIETHGVAEVEILDLDEYQFPLFEERLAFMSEPSPAILEYADKIKKADGVLIMCPEYNGGYPASLKNAIDLLHPEWRKKPVGIVAISGGQFGGSQALMGLEFVMWKIGAWVIPAQFPVPFVGKTFDEKGKASDAEKSDARAKKFVNELLWCIEAQNKMKEYKPILV